jgi:uroporphyrinogen decarboxylase
MTQNLFLSTIARNKSDKTPIWMMRQAGRYLDEYKAVRATQSDFISFCLNPEASSKVTLQPIHRFGFDAAIIFSDILMVPWALDRNVRFEKNIGPLLDAMDQPNEVPEKTLDSLSVKLAPIGEAILKTKMKLDPKIALIGFAGAPWTLITYMAEGGSSRDFPKARLWAWQERKALEGLLEILIAATIDFLTLQGQSGAQALMLFDSWAGAVPAAQRDWLVTEPTRKIIAGLRKNGLDQPVIGFPKGFGDGLIKYANESNVDAIGLDHGVDPVWAAKYLPESMPVQGNLDPISLVTGGSHMMSNIDVIMTAFHNRPHIFNLGHGITPQTPVSHVQAMIDHVRNR